MSYFTQIAQRASGTVPENTLRPDPGKAAFRSAPETEAVVSDIRFIQPDAAEDQSDPALRQRPAFFSPSPDELTSRPPVSPPLRDPFREVETKRTASVDHPPRDIRKSWEDPPSGDVREIRPSEVIPEQKRKEMEASPKIGGEKEVIIREKNVFPIPPRQILSVDVQDLKVVKPRMEDRQVPEERERPSVKEGAPLEARSPIRPRPAPSPDAPAKAEPPAILQPRTPPMADKPPPRPRLPGKKLTIGRITVEMTPPPVGKEPPRVRTVYRSGSSGSAFSAGRNLRYSHRFGLGQL